jgi:hypothetical protein
MWAVPIRAASFAVPDAALYYSLYYCEFSPSTPLHVVSEDEDERLDQLIADRMERLTGTHDGTIWKCLVCERRYKDKTKMKHHIETHLNSVQPCPLCSQTCKTRRTLKTHIARAHHNAAVAVDLEAQGGGGSSPPVADFGGKNAREQDVNSNPFEPKIELTSE